MVHSPAVADASQGSTEPVLWVVFFRTEAGNEPVRQWLKELKREDRKAVGEDIKTAQYGWPLGMPLIRKLEPAYGRSALGSAKASREFSLPSMMA